MAILSFSAANGQYESDWFKPQNPFQLDLQFAESEFVNPVEIYSANTNTETDRKKYALAARIPLKNTTHINMPVRAVISGAEVYYKIGCRLKPTSASYLTE